LLRPAGCHGRLAVGAVVAPASFAVVAAEEVAVVAGGVVVVVGARAGVVVVAVVGGFGTVTVAEGLLEPCACTGGATV